VTGPLVIDWLEQLGPPVVVNRGNHDLFDDDRFDEVTLMEYHGWRLGTAHIVLDPRSDPERITLMKKRGYGTLDLDILIAGDTHYERIEYVENTLLLNSGSLTLPHNQTVRLGSVALLELTRDRARAEIIPIGETEGLSNPVYHAEIEIDRRGVIGAAYAGSRLEMKNGHLDWPGPAPRDQM
jgi:putative phosphoesterase